MEAPRRPRDGLTPYASLLPEVSTFKEFLPAMVDLVAIGPDFALMVDVGFAFDSVERAVRAAESREPYDVYFLETPLWSDDLDGYAELARRAAMRIAAGEWLATRFEFEELLDRGLVAVAQPDIGRVGGLMEARRVSELVAARGPKVVPHCWKTRITVARPAISPRSRHTAPTSSSSRPSSPSRRCGASSSSRSSRSRTGGSLCRRAPASASSSTATRSRASPRRPSGSCRTMTRVTGGAL